MQIDLQETIFSSINFPWKVITISQIETWKLKTLGGIKILNLEVKSVVPKVKWLNMVTDKNMKQNFDIFSPLVGI